MRGSSILRALSLAGVGLALSAGVAAANTYDLTTDIAANPTANPAPDAYGIAGVYSFRYGADHAAPYSLMDSGTPIHGVPGGNPSDPAYNTPLGGFQGGVVTTHPGPPADHSQDSVIAFTSPITGALDVTATFTDQNPGCGQGVGYFIDRGATTLAAGNVANGGAATETPATVNVTAGDVLYFAVNTGVDDFSCDSTQVEFTINGTPAATDCSRIIVNRDDPTAGGSDSADVPVTVPGGFDHVENVQVTNGVVTVPTVTRGSTDTFNVRTVKSIDGQRTEFSFDVVDVAGAIKHCE